MKFQWTGIKIITLIAFSTLLLSSCDGGKPSITAGLSGLSGNSSISEGADSMNSTSDSDGDMSGSSSGSTASNTGSQTSSMSSGGVNTGFDLNSITAFSLDNPSGVPNFTDEEIRNQKIAGSKLLKEIETAANNPALKEFVIPAGNYGYDLNKIYSGVASGFVLKNIKRPDDNPFVIKAAGVTFWFSLTNKPAPNCSRAVHLVNCDNLTIEGLTVDSYTSNTIEGKLTKIDVPYNRIEIELSDGTIADDNLISNFDGTEKRIIPVKANGDAIPELYNINSTWGVEYMYIRKVEKSSDGHYWLYFKSQLLLNTIFESDWLNQYGKDGSLEKGDGICLIYGTIFGISLDNCKQITVKDFSCYIGKGGFWENGGYGNHQWLNCRFSPRPGTNRILGGDGSMTQGIRNGSLFDHLYMGISSDDAVNIHGFWSKVKTISSNTVLFDFAPVGIQAGDPVEFYDGSGKLVETNTVKETPASNYNYNGFLLGPIKLESEPSQKVMTLIARWPNSECANWKISNSYFDGIYQRILIQSGPGIFENNTVRNMGSNLAIDTNTAAYEGGFLENIVVRNNVFINTSVHPGASPIKLSFATNWAANMKAKNITIKDNVFFRAGASAISLVNTDAVTISGNYFLDMYEASNSMTPYLELPNTAVAASQSGNLKISGNKIYIRSVKTEGNGVVNQTAVLSSNEVINSASGIIDKVWQYAKGKEAISVADFLTGAALK